MTEHADDSPRRRQRPQAAAADPIANAPRGESRKHDTERGPTRAQLRQLYLLKLRGLTQREIGERLGRSERTIRAWQKRLNPAELGLQEAFSPLATVNQDLAQLAVDAQRFRIWQRQAEADGDLKLAGQMLDRARAVDRERQALLQRLNVYDAARAVMPHARDTVATEADDWLALLDLDRDVSSEGEAGDDVPR